MSSETIQTILQKLKCNNGNVPVNSASNLSYYFFLTYFQLYQYEPDQLLPLVSKHRSQMYRTKIWTSTFHTHIVNFYF